MKKISVALVKKFCTREVISYLVCGILTTVLALIVYGLCILLGHDVVISNTVCTVVSVLFAYVVNRIFVFQSKVRGFIPILIEFIKFVSGRLVAYVMETLLLVLLATFLGEADMMKFIYKSFTTIMVMVVNYFISKWAVFRKKRSQP